MLVSDCKKIKEQIVYFKVSFFQSQFFDDVEVYWFIEVIGFVRSEIKKWFSDYWYWC